VSEDEGILGK